MAKRIPLDQLPAICDYDCPAADFPPAETAGICRTMSAVWCRQLNELVNKNRPCEYRARLIVAAPAKTPSAMPVRPSARKQRVSAKPAKTRRSRNPG